MDLASITAESDDQTKAYMDKAWNLLTLLIRHGNPVPISDLAVGCTSEVVEHLCRIPDSPLMLTENGFVAISQCAMLAFVQFVFRATGRVALGVDARVMMRPRRKRKGPVFPPIASKRRSVLLLKDQVEISEADANGSLLSLGNKIQGDFDDKGIWFNRSDFKISTGDSLNYAMAIFKQHNTMDSLILSHDNLLSNGVWNDTDHDRGLSNADMICNHAGPLVVIRDSQVSTNSDSDCHLRGIGIKMNKILPNATPTDPTLISEPDADQQTREIMPDVPVALKNSGEKCTQATCEIMAGNSVKCDSGHAKLGLSDFLRPVKSVICDGARAFAEFDKPNKQVICDFGYAEVGPSDFLGPVKPTICDGARASIDIDKPHKHVICDSSHAMLGPRDFLRPIKPVICDCARASVEIYKPYKHATCDSGHHTDLTPRVSFIPGDQLALKDSKQKENKNGSKQQSHAEGVAKCTRKKIRRQNQNMPIEDNIGDGSTSLSVKIHVETRKLPHFESFMVEDEEGSGGYGTVYRAQRKTDGKTVAIKCPHPTAHSHHIINELRMLEKFGGRNFVIKFEGSFKTNNSECFVLEHVKHDRPEVLKKQIDISEIQWYGYCMFKALASLHKQEIVHRDVKPGNFLYSRKLNKGYLIDFNLALDLNQKHRSIKVNPKGGICQTLNLGKPASPTQSRKALNCNQSEYVSKNVNKDPKTLLLPKSGRSRRTDKEHKGSVVKGLHNLESRNNCRSQAADASGLTSAKDATSNMTPSVERLREPIPCHGRRELINLVHEAMQNPKQNTSLTPTSQRKRIAAPVGKAERMIALLTPMPLCSNGVSISSIGILKNRGDGKHKNEGPCVGTKGFRAPEVLFRSFYQGCKIDMWSAGVTLLYLMIGRTPFGGEPDQNIKDIAKLRGSEDLWEVAKLHNQESSFPAELFNVQSLQFMGLKSWCQKNTRRPEFLERIPHALFDLLDKCLTVNPRLRISAEEALMHDFFSPCRESLRKQRLLRLSLASQTPIHKEERR